jgi:hypothetical protein
VLYSQPGKHTFAPDPSLFTATVRAREQLREACYSRAGSGGILRKDDLFDDQVAKDAARDALATAYLKARAFDPAFDFTQAVALDEPTLVPWPALRAWIPGRLDRIPADLNERQAR